MFLLVLFMFSCNLRDSASEKATEENKLAVSKQIKLHLKFEIEEVGCRLLTNSQTMFSVFVIFNMLGFWEMMQCLKEETAKLHKM